MKNGIRGIFPVVPTPLTDNEELDLDGLRHLIDHYIKAGCHGLVILGSGGELPYFTARERIEIIKAALDAVQSQVPVVVGCGYMSLAQTLDFFRNTQFLAINAYLTILPVYYPVGFENIYRYYKTLGEQSPKPILYYNYPQITGHFLNPDQIKRILMLNGIAGIKESTLSVPSIRKYITVLTERPISVFTGSTFILNQVLALGGAGAICPIPSIAPHLVNECYQANIEGNLPLAHKRQNDILSLVPILNTFSLPMRLQKAMVQLVSNIPKPPRSAGRASRHAIVKETLRQLGHPITARVRSPLPQINESEKAAISAIIRQRPFLEKERVV